MATPDHCHQGLNWDLLNLQSMNLQGIADPFIEDELKKAVFETPTDKAPDPDGFTEAFFKNYWEVIKFDIVEAANAFHNMRTTSLLIINTTNIVLLPKKEDAETVADFRPIRLIHSFVKIITKPLALILAPHMKKLISSTQSAFVKKRSIHDNFLTVRNMVWRYDRLKIPAFFFKLDIAKAFDFVCWDYFLTVLDRMGFPQRWRDWIASLFTPPLHESYLMGYPTSRYSMVELANPIHHSH